MSVDSNEEKDWVYIGYNCHQNIPGLSIKSLLKFTNESKSIDQGTGGHEN